MKITQKLPIFSESKQNKNFKEQDISGFSSKDAFVRGEKNELNLIKPQNFTPERPAKRSWISTAALKKAAVIALSTVMLANPILSSASAVAMSRADNMIHNNETAVEQVIQVQEESPLQQMSDGTYTIIQQAEGQSLLQEAGTQIIAEQQIQGYDLAANPFKLTSPYMTGQEIKSFQESLNLLLPEDKQVEVNGVYNESTADAVKYFQQQEGLRADGVVGNHTYGVMWYKHFWGDTDHIPELNPPEFYDQFQNKDLLLSVNVNPQVQHVQIIDKSTGDVLRTLPVSSGTNNRTPVYGEGNYREITEISPKPWWYPPNSTWAQGFSNTPPGPNNPLGPVKIRIGNSPILFHGTPAGNFGAIGRAPSSNGCMRMFPHHAWELQSVIGIGTPVQIINQAP